MTPLGAAEVEILADLNTVGTTGAGFYSFDVSSAVLDDRYFLFGANDSVAGSEPWSLDLTTGELVRLADIAEGAEGSRPEQFTPIGSIALFVATSFDAGEELWATDGTAAGTYLVKDILPGAGDSGILELFRIPGDRAVFRANDGVLGGELWMSDGSAAGTALVADIRPGAASSLPGSFLFNGGTLFFRANDGTSGAELWKWNGIATALVADIEPGAGSSSPSHIFPVAGGYVVFRATTTADGAELWASDGGAVGTTLVSDINPTGSSLPYNFFYHTGLNRLFFTADDGVHGYELFQLASGVVTRLSDLVPGIGSSSPTGFGETATKLLFTARDGAPGTRLFAYDGATIAPLASLSAGGAPNVPQFVTSWNGEVFLNHGTCWRSDGTVAGTVAFAEPCLSAPAFGVGDGRLVYGGWNSGPRELYSIDSGHAFARETEVASLSSDPSELFWFGERLFFAADDGVSGRELWVWDRTSAAGPVLIDVDSGAGSSKPSGFVAFQGEVWFTATSAATGEELWRTDGTAAGTSVYEIEPGTGRHPSRRGGRRRGVPLRVDRRRRRPVPHFVGRDAAGARGVRERRVAPCQVARCQRRRAGLRRLDADDRQGAFHPWRNRSRPCSARARRGPRRRSSRPRERVRQVGQRSLLPRRRRRIQSPRCGSTTASRHSRSRRSRMAPFPTSSRWARTVSTWLRTRARSDASSIVATASPPCPFSTSRREPRDSSPADLTSVGGRLYFRASDATAGSELWWTDGATAERFADLSPGASGSSPQQLVPTGERLVFVANDGVAGEEIFLANVSSATRLPEILPGPATAAPELLSVSPDGCQVVFSAAHPELGREPFWIELCRLFVDGFESGDTSAWSSGSPN